MPDYLDSKIFSDRFFSAIRVDLIDLALSYNQWYRSLNGIDNPTDYFTDHGAKHIEGVLRHLIKLGKLFSLTIIEKFFIASACLFHDIGMHPHSDLFNNSLQKKILETLGNNDGELTELMSHYHSYSRKKRNSEETNAYYEQKLREYHSRFSSILVNPIYSLNLKPEDLTDNLLLLHKAFEARFVKRNLHPDSGFRALSFIIKYHQSKFNLNEIPLNYRLDNVKKIRLRMLCAVMKFIDELDYGRHRVRYMQVNKQKELKDRIIEIIIKNNINNLFSGLGDNIEINKEEKEEDITRFLKQACIEAKEALMQNNDCKKALKAIKHMGDQANYHEINKAINSCVYDSHYLELNFGDVEPEDQLCDKIQKSVQSEYNIASNFFKSIEFDRIHFLWFPRQDSINVDIKIRHLTNPNIVRTHYIKIKDKIDETMKAECVFKINDCRRKQSKSKLEQLKVTVSTINDFNEFNKLSKEGLHLAQLFNDYHGTFIERNETYSAPKIIDIATISWNFLKNYTEMLGQDPDFAFLRAAMCLGLSSSGLISGNSHNNIYEVMDASEDDFFRYYELYEKFARNQVLFYLRYSILYNRFKEACLVNYPHWILVSLRRCFPAIWSDPGNRQRVAPNALFFVSSTNKVAFEIKLKKFEFRNLDREAEKFIKMLKKARAFLARAVEYECEKLCETAEAKYSEICKFATEDYDEKPTGKALVSYFTQTQENALNKAFSYCPLIVEENELNGIKIDNFNGDFLVDTLGEFGFSTEGDVNNNEISKVHFSGVKQVQDKKKIQGVYITFSDNRAIIMRGEAVLYQTPPEARVLDKKLLFYILLRVAFRRDNLFPENFPFRFDDGNYDDTSEMNTFI